MNEVPNVTLHDGIEVPQMAFDREIGHLAIAPAGPAPVVLDEADPIREPLVGALQDGNPPFPFEVRERDAGQVHQRGPVADRRPRDADPIGGGRELDLRVAHNQCQGSPRR